MEAPSYSDIPAVPKANPLRELEIQNMYSAEVRKHSPSVNPYEDGKLFLDLGWGPHVSSDRGKHRVPKGLRGKQLQE